MTIRALGDFSQRIGTFSVGAKVYVDGPHGVFTMDRQQAQGYVFIAGRVGITPLFSMLLTMRERGDIRPVTLFYANRSWEDVTFREQLAELEDSMLHLEVVHVLEEPPEDWPGDTGRIDAVMIRRHVPDWTIKRLVLHLRLRSDDGRDGDTAARAIGVPASRLNTERFNFV